MNSKFKTLLILMWRHSLMWKHRYIKTTLELFSTIVVFVYLYFNRHMVSGESIAENSIPLGLPLNIPISNIPGPSKVLYTPENNETKALMYEIANELKIPVESFTTPYPENYQNDKQGVLNNTVGERFKNKAIVEFKNLNYFPGKLEYSVKMANRRWVLSTNRSFRAGEFFKPTLRLQWEIDKTYIKKLTGESIAQELHLQEFPRKRIKPYSDGPPNMDFLDLYMSLANNLGLLLPFIFTASRLVEERLTGVMELINMEGASRIMLICSHLLNGMPTCLLYSIVATLSLKVGKILPKTNGFLLFLMFALHFISIIMAAMLTSFITDRREYGTALAIMVYIIFIPVIDIIRGFFTGDHNLLVLNYLISCIVPSAPFSWFYRELQVLEPMENGVTISTMFSKHNDSNLPVIWSYAMVLMQIFMFYLLVIYLSFVRPGPYGIAKRWNFIFKKNEKFISSGETRYQDPRYFENPPEGKEVGIKIINVSKVHKHEVALNNVSIDIYKGDITILLGHNSAGKTTLMNIITGMTSPTAGEVLVNGEPNTQEIRRREMGLCPQHNIFLPSLTVMEHVLFFAMLKDHSYQVAKYSSSVLLEELGLIHKANTPSNQLSGGFKRRLQLACALSGNTSVLVLDEPTSGLDVETRRDIWNLLLRLRGSRTMLLSTHIMEEADTFADRVAALSQGELVCYAPPMFLRSSIGSGYILTISTDGMPNETDITQTVTKNLPHATLRESGPNSVTYNLPMHMSSEFPQFFSSLELLKDDLRIVSMGVGVSSMEDVFNKMCSNVSAEEEEAAKAMPTTSYKLITPPALYCRQMAALIKRQMLYIWSSKYYFLFLNIILPLSIVIPFAILIGKLLSGEIYLKPRGALAPTSLDVQRMLYEESTSLHLASQPRRRVYFDINDTNTLYSLRKKFKDTLFLLSSNISADVKKIINKNAVTYKHTLAGLKINATTIQIFYTPHLHNAAANALNLATNAILNKLTSRRAGGSTKNFTIITYDKDPKPPEDTLHAITLITIMTLMTFVVMIFFATLLSVDTLLKQERQDNTRRLHLMAGCPVIIHWMSRLLFHVLLYTLLLILPILLMLLMYDEVGTFHSIEVLGVFALILLLGLISWLSFIYLVISCSLGSLVINVACMFGVILGFFDSLSKIKLLPKPNSWLWKIIYSASWIFLPPHVGCNACLKTLYIALPEKYNLNKTDRTKYFEWAESKPLPDLCQFLIQFLYQMLLLVLIEEGCLFFDFSKKISESKTNHNKNVTAESEYVEKTISNPHSEIPDIMLVNKLYKTYTKGSGKSVHAVKGLSFSVKKGECFGLLGVNGAGKSTTFKMITTETEITSGNIWANKQFLKIPRGKYLKSLSYCPQFMGVDAFLTGKENLSLLLKIRGLSDADIKHEADLWLKVVGLEKIGHVAVNDYSGGCKRRASTACSLCTASPLTLMDEPTTGVDVVARRRVWIAVRRVLEAKRAVVITSHSMDEMEALCGRLGIMSAGEMCTFGSVPALKAEHAAGFALKLKHAVLKDTILNKHHLMILKNDLNNSFFCTLKDEHESLLQYHIDENMPYSVLFTKLEDLKSRHKDYIENYTISETTLEELFLSFAQCFINDNEESRSSRASKYPKSILKNA